MITVTLFFEVLVDLLANYRALVSTRADDGRLETIRREFRITRGPAWLLERLVTADGRLLRRGALKAAMRLAGEGRALDPAQIDAYADQVRLAIGADAIETVDRQGWRITPMGRLRARRAGLRPA